MTTRQLCSNINPPPPASACPSPSLWCCLDQSSTLAKITKESVMEYTMLLADWRVMASRSAKLLLFLPFVSPPQSVSLSASLLEGHEALAEHDSVCERCLGCLWSGFYDYCWEKHKFYMAFFWHTNPMISNLTFAWSHLATSTGLQYWWVQLAESLTIL